MINNFVDQEYEVCCETTDCKGMSVLRKIVYKVLIAIFIIILIGTLIYFYIKYNKYMISNTQYNILSSEITYDDEQIFADGPTKIARSFQELLDIEESSDKVKKAFSTLQVKDESINQYFNEEFFNDKML